MTARLQDTRLVYTVVSCLLAAAAAKSLQLCLTLCDTIDWSPPPGSSTHGIFQARVLEWVSLPSLIAFFYTIN